ncbi:2-oxo-4-hydroxy-4-carboxy-5-ureidoimidazoline decarboxylase [Chitinophaga agrisoli]|uniref:2-oxo-4-hydroxy-4-carboxy-5-ureidoimidazoline decarboxylase n=1 Tax=Chitinophaga agrisoli TaxID=2607653 RepID=A0A5B2VSW2_9BACT|nr:2-oxo-4-hydroxy-4-carboxy-5-ureidoimidazoline decarboxylase [Chitinophaga agrisoli]KAA2241366.1 2-oxo-4-hydroxy-4-carboxy-5-ureidoimidazoline decarboxylase [Chitinophaga agrisoli]
MTLTVLNQLPLPELQETLRRCCGATAWVEKMCARFPLKDTDELLDVADIIWRNCTEADWKEAFTHHPQIGDLAALQQRFADTAQWAAGEQAGVSQAHTGILQALAAGNQAYLQKFGYIFIVCASGRSAEEMLQLLTARLPHNPEEEIFIAMQEQAKITRIRLEKLLSI